MGFIIFLIIAFLAFLNSQSSSPVNKSDSNKSNSYGNSYSNTERNASQENLNRNDRGNDDSLIQYHRLISKNFKREFSGKYNVLLSSENTDVGYFYLFRQEYLK